MIQIEMAIYLLLGVHPVVLELWQTVHRKWRYKSSSLKGFGFAKRLTGQATTALGNVVVNMIVH